VFVYSFTWFNKGNPEKHLKWKSRKLETKLTEDEFVEIMKTICLQRNYLLLELSHKHAYIKMCPSWAHWGAYFYIELNQENNTATIWCSGGVSRNNFRNVWLMDMMSLLYK